jgi:hypothetical protein
MRSRCLPAIYLLRRGEEWKHLDAVGADQRNHVEKLARCGGEIQSSSQIVRIHRSPSRKKDLVEYKSMKTIPIENAAL